MLFVNDSKATNADAAAKALATFEPIYWIAGGQAKEGGIVPLEDYFPRIAKAYLIGTAADEFSDVLARKVPHVIAGDLETAVRLAAADAAHRWPCGADGAALARLRLLRPVRRFRGAGRGVPPRVAA